MKARSLRYKIVAFKIAELKIAEFKISRRVHFDYKPVEGQA